MRFWIAALLATLALLVVPMLVHHSFSAEFDGSKAVTLEGVVTKVEWANPHVYFFIDVKDSKDAVANWGCETSGPNQLIQ
jgi:Family of unknown function (DUF6152)